MESVWNDSAVIPLPDITNIAASTGVGYTGWLDSALLAGAKALVLYYSADRLHDVYLYADEDIPGTTSYLNGNTGQAKLRTSVPASDWFYVIDPFFHSNLKLGFGNNDGSLTMSITNLKMRVQY